MLVRNTLLTVALLLAFPCAAGEEETPISPARPGYGDTVSTLKQGQFQYEVGYSFVNFENYLIVGDGNKDVSQHSLGEMLLRYGLLERLELNIGIGSFIEQDLPDKFGFTNSSLAAKYRLKPKGDAAKTELAVIGGITSQTGVDFGDNDTNFFVGFASDTELSNAYSLSGYAGYVEGQNELTVSAYFNGALNQKWAFAAGVAAILSSANARQVLQDGTDYNIGGEGDAAIYPLKEVEDQFVFDFNATYPIGLDSQVDFYAGTGLDDKSPNFFFGFGYAHRF